MGIESWLQKDKTLMTALLENLIFKKTTEGLNSAVVISMLFVQTVISESDLVRTFIRPLRINCNHVSESSSSVI